MGKKVEDNERNFETAHDVIRRGRILFFDLTGFLALLHRCFEAVGANRRQMAIDKLLGLTDWVIVYTDKHTLRRVFTEKEDMDHEHEIQTAKALCQKDYDVLFAPAGMFDREDKKFDVFLIRGHIILKADLKSISSKNPDTIAKRIKYGAEQASRVVLDIVSDIEKKVLIDGLRSGVTKNRLIREILLFYNSRFYRLSKDEILSRKIFSLIK
jgi:hypothetical protein